MAETTLESGIDQAYEQLRAELNQRKCKIIAEEPPSHISAIQGSLWGTSAKTAQKTITYTLQHNPTGTSITSKSALTKNYINFTLIGCIFSIALMVICAWIALDLQAYASNGTQGLWSWLSQVNGHLDPDKAALFIRLTGILAAFLALTLVAEAIILASIRRGIKEYARETLKALKK